MGKSLLARAVPGILPRLELEEVLEVTRIYSVADMLNGSSPLARTRPFRSPHHTISQAGLVGGGTVPRPGEISLAHRGVLFLDEIVEHSTKTLEVLRQPIEDKIVTISRAQGTVTFPANFLLIAARNPCPCGYYGDNTRTCTCSPTMIQRYQAKLSGPLLDRIDIHVDVPRVDYDKLMSDRRGEPSKSVRGARRTRQRVSESPLQGSPWFVCQCGHERGGGAAVLCAICRGPSTVGAFRPPDATQCQIIPSDAQTQPNHC